MVVPLNHCEVRRVCFYRKEVVRVQEFELKKAKIY